MGNEMDDICKLLRAIANGTDARASQHSIIFTAAADTIEQYREDAAFDKRVNKSLRDDVARLKKALEFYANPFEWKKLHDPENDVQVPDFYSETSFGDTATEALTDAERAPQQEQENQMADDIPESIFTKFRKLTPEEVEEWKQKNPGKVPGIMGGPSKLFTPPRTDFGDETSE